MTERMTAVAMDRADGSAAGDDGLRALPAERLDGVAAPAPRASADRWAGLAATLALHVAILAALFARAWTPEAAPPTREIPVEVVVEPPPAPPSPAAAPSPQASAAARPLDLEPAHDAPRAANEEKNDRDAPDAKTKAPPSPTPEATPATPTPSANATPSPSATPPANAKPQQKSAPDAEQAAAPTAALPDDGGPLPANNATPDEYAAPAANRPAMIGQPFPSWSKGKPFSTFEPPPDFAFAAPAEKSESPISGEARKTYLTVLYGKIMSRLRLTDRMRVDSERLEGKIDFVVDGHGALVQRSVTQPSGAPDLDAAALEAVAEAAPYPTPPMGMPLRLTFTYGAK
jgi:protein TonB